ncbi:MalY/PatB family protein [Spiroplasma cantharicola]|uniref:cysteine-S-conjugate beta-lyase n=1 Tax=Spiroplasma cantharicola TaxID=362837 RepID=A0A0M3SJ50_9MOLU|nr:aminotransferase class I/II-fold pyridoxal phosphate-dependent enzyme [Spiroplasma cantharicola]ALD66124.1 cystathione beta-lyase [Spiroplasma cantharicola]
MNKSFNKKIDRSKSNERKWSIEYLEENYKIDFSKKFYNLSIADLDFQTPKPIVKSIISRAKKKTYSYTYTEKKSLQAIQIWYKKMHEINLKTDLIKLVHGTVNAMFEVVKCFTKEKESVLIQSPIYQPFERSIIKTKRNVIYNNLIYRDDNYYIDFVDFENKIVKNKIKLFLWCNPHNPGGRVWEQEEILKIIEICNKNKVLIFSDEVHGDLVLNQKHNSLLNYSNLIKDFIVCNSPNKTFNLGGLKGSYMICSNKNIFEQISNQYEIDSLTSPNIFFQPALISAYTNNYSYNWLKKLKEYIYSNYTFLKQQLSNFQNLEIMQMQASYLVWIKFKSKLSLKDIKQQFIDNNLILSFSDDFADCKDNWIRLNIGINKKTLKQVVNKLKLVVFNIKGEK